MYFRFQKFRVPGVSRVSRLSVECFEFKEFQRSKFLAIFPVKIFLKREKRKKIWISKVSNFETLSGCEKRKKNQVTTPISCLWNDEKSVNGSVCSSIDDKWAVPMKPRSTSLSASLSLSFSLFLSTFCYFYLSVCLALLSVCLSLYLCFCLSVV